MKTFSKRNALIEKYVATYLHGKVKAAHCIASRRRENCAVQNFHGSSNSAVLWPTSHPMEFGFIFRASCEIHIHRIGAVSSTTISLSSSEALARIHGAAGCWIRANELTVRENGENTETMKRYFYLLPM